MRPGRNVTRQQSGFTYVTVMAIIALLGIGLAELGPLWAEQGRRTREQELLRIGALYAQAIGEYYQASPGNQRSYPPDLESLTLDRRFVGVRRHLRRLYEDPLAPGRQWMLIRTEDGGIRGVYSQDTRAPFARKPLQLGDIELPRAERYADWKFMPKEPK